MRGNGRRLLFGKLNPTCYQTLEAAAVLAKHRGHALVELAHWFDQLFRGAQNDFSLIAGHCHLDDARLAADLVAALAQFHGDAHTVRGFSPKLDELVRDAAVCAEAMGHSAVRSGHLLLAAMENSRLRAELMKLSLEFEAIDRDRVCEQFDDLTRGSVEGGGAGGAAAAEPAESRGAVQPEGTSTTGERTAVGASVGEFEPGIMQRRQSLARFAVDLTEAARRNAMDPVVGRESEIRQLIGILLRRHKNNPILVGDAGVGKTSVVEGFAQKVAAGEVPPPLRDVSVWSLDIGLLVAGASMKGEFEARLRQVIDEVQHSPRPIILFVDEAHALVGAGGAKGQGDAANLLKPALARGTLRMIAATTHAEFKEYFEQDPALTRRFEVVSVAEPADRTACIMLRAVVRKFEEHHAVLVLDEAIEASVKLSRRYLPSRQLPDKAVGLLDTACARVALAQRAAPPAIEQTQAMIRAMEGELSVVKRELALGQGCAARAVDVENTICVERRRLADLERRWDDERQLVQTILRLRAAIDPSMATSESDGGSGGGGGVVSAPSAATSVVDPPAPSAEPSSSGSSELGEPPGAGLGREQVLEQIRHLQVSLKQLQRESPLVMPSVDAQAVADVVSEYTGIPVGRMMGDEIRAILDLPQTLSRRVVGQGHALEAIARQITNSRVPGLDNATRPIGVFLLVGPSGVGKTETALALAEALYGGEQNLITINMSEYQEAHTVALLKGAPPGYIGYGKGGILTEAVRRRPYSVVLLDEVEKAHPDVHEIFFQVFDKGFMDDSEGRRIDFKNTVFLLTSNVGSEHVLRAFAPGRPAPEPGELAALVREPLRSVFPDALLGRIEVVPYQPITVEMQRTIIRLQLERIAARLSEQQGIPFVFDDAVLDAIAARCTDPESGARRIGAIIHRELVPRISHEYLTRLADEKAINRVALGVGDDGRFSFAFD